MNNLMALVATAFGLIGFAGTWASIIAADVPHGVSSVSLVALAVLIADQRDTKQRVKRIEAVFFKREPKVGRAKGAGQ